MSKSSASLIKGYTNTFAQISWHRFGLQVVLSEGAMKTQYNFKQFERTSLGLVAKLKKKR